MKLMSLLFASLFLCGCHTIHIKNGDTTGNGPERDKWQHIGILGLVEFSDPVQIENTCGPDNWAEVRTRQNVGQVFLGLVPYLSYAWSPKEATIMCAKTPVEKKTATR
jgi:hypothetical protein